MIGIDALNECHGLRQYRDIATNDALHHFVNREFTTAEAVTIQIGVDDALLFDTTIHLEAGIFGTIFRMVHIIKELEEVRGHC